MFQAGVWESLHPLEYTAGVRTKPTGAAEEEAPQNGGNYWKRGETPGWAEEGILLRHSFCVSWVLTNMGKRCQWTWRIIITNLLFFKWDLGMSPYLGLFLDPPWVILNEEQWLQLLFSLTFLFPLRMRRSCWRRLRRVRTNCWSWRTCCCLRKARWPQPKLSWTRKPRASERSTSNHTTTNNPLLLCCYSVNVSSGTLLMLLLQTASKCCVYWFIVNLI